MEARRVAVAFSGGRDSTALLHATHRAARALGIEPVALHVHHGLHADADGWLDHCEQTCARWKLRLISTRLSARPGAGESVEAWARLERYRALAAMARANDASIVLLAQHRRDQAETFLLQALRGGGVAGLAGMPASFVRDGLLWARPWLHQPREAIEAYVRHYRLRFIDDSSNDDPRFARNRLRVEVWPALTAAFEHAEAALTDAARRAAHASELLDEVADADLARLVDDHGLDVMSWRELSPARRRNVLLAWLRRVGIASASLIDRLIDELPGARNARWPAAEDCELRLYRGRLQCVATQKPVHAFETVLSIPGAGSYAVPGWVGRLVVERVEHGGVSAALVTSLRAKRRQGGEAFQLRTRSTPRSLKKQFQSRGVSAWERDGPLLFAGDQLLYVPGLGIDARLRAAAGELQFDIRWDPHGGY